MSKLAESLWHKYHWHKYHSWERDFRKDARADNYAVFEEHLERLEVLEDSGITIDEVPGTPSSMLESTIEVVAAVLAYAQIDGIKSKKFLSMQKYDPDKATDARYVFTFDLFDAVARVFIDARKAPLDLADLFNHPWSRLKSVGYWKIWVSHPDWSPLTKAEYDFLEGKITDDLRYDYGEDEMDIVFTPYDDGRCLIVYVQSVEE